jgi:hypothetical protein
MGNRLNGSYPDKHANFDGPTEMEMRAFLAPKDEPR